MDKYLAAALLLALGRISTGAHADNPSDAPEATAAAIAAYRAENPGVHRPPEVSKRSPDTRQARRALPPLPRAADDRPRLSLPGHRAAH